MEVNDHELWMTNSNGAALRPIVVLKNDVGVEKLGNHAVKLVHLE